MQICTWNVAGLRARIDIITHWLGSIKPDIVCLQEVKCTEDKFPYAIFYDLGYDIILNVQPQFNGVAIIYKKGIPFISIEESPDLLKHEARFIEASFDVMKKPLYVSCLYAPNGNPKNTSKFTYKLDWLNALYQYAKGNIKKNIILAGDFNVIPNENNAKDISLWINDALYAKSARDIFRKICNLGFKDTSILCNSKINYSFWDFRQNAWQKDNGIRIDFLLTSPYTTDKLIKAYSHKDVRGCDKPSDHIPISIELDIN